MIKEYGSSGVLVEIYAEKYLCIMLIWISK